MSKISKFIKLNIVAACALFLIACGHAISTPGGFVPENLSSNDIKLAITKALDERGWQVIGSKDNKIMAKLNVRSHEAIVEIPFTDKSYQIQYVSSQNLNETANGKIHKRYNLWVKKLSADISNELFKISHTK